MRDQGAYVEPARRNRDLLEIRCAGNIDDGTRHVGRGFELAQQIRAASKDFHRRGVLGQQRYRVADVGRGIQFECAHRNTSGWIVPLAAAPCMAALF
jgi:hypothetical protein